MLTMCHQCYDDPVLIMMDNDDDDDDDEELVDLRILGSFQCILGLLLAAVCTSELWILIAAQLKKKENKKSRKLSWSCQWSLPIQDSHICGYS